MATSLTDFKSALVFGGARPSLFEFKVSAPPNGVSATLGNVQFYCSVSEIIK